MLRWLAHDVVEIQGQLDHGPATRTAERIYAALARLSALIADELMVLGDPAQSRAWYLTARRAALAAHTPGLAADVTALSALLPLYYGDPVDTVRLAQRAIELGAEPGALAAALAPTYRAVALAQLGDADAGHAALVLARAGFDSLTPPYRTESVFGFSLRRWRFYEGKIFSYLGRTEDAWRIHDEALALYPADVVGDPALIRFDRAISLVRSNQIAEGCGLAHQTLLELPDEHWADIFTRAARRVAQAVPVGAHGSPAARQLRHALAAPPGDRRPTFS